MPGKLLLNSWKEIAEFVGRTERTVQRWEKLYGLPVHRPAGRERSRGDRISFGNRSLEYQNLGMGLNAVPTITEPSDEPFNPTGAAATVLCIDSQPERLATRKKLLEFGGYRVLTACDARQAFVF